MRRKSYYLSLAAVTMLIATSVALFIPFDSETTFDAEGDFSGTTAMIVAGDTHTTALKADGTVWAWGSNNLGQLGDGTTTGRPYPVQVKATDSTYLTNITMIAADSSNSVALKDDGTVWTWGFNNPGQLGDGTTTNSSYPVQVKTSESVYLTNITAIAVGQQFMIALKGDGTVWAWGYNTLGQLADGTTAHKSYATQAKTSESTYLTNITAISAGFNHTLALKSGGTVWAAGYNGDGRLGDGTNTSRSYFVQVNASESTPLTGVTKIETGGRQSFALKGDGTAWAWGSNVYGQLGDGTTTDRFYPVRVKASEHTYLENIKMIAGGENHTVALRADGTVWAWGYNLSKQIGDGMINGTHYPVQSKSDSTTNVAGVIMIATGINHTIVLKGDGTVWAWGSNSNGQLGDGTTTNGPYSIQTKAGDSTYLYLFTPITGITITSEGSATTITTDDGTLQMSATMLPSDATGAVIWSVSNNNVATINSSGLLTALSNGTVVIKATANDGSGVFDEFEVTISGQTVSDNDDGIDPMIIAVIAIIAIAAVGGAVFFLLKKK